MSSQEFRWWFLPYCIDEVEKGRYVVLNRAYEPVGYGPDEWAEYEPHTVKIKMTTWDWDMSHLYYPLRSEKICQERSYLQRCGFTLIELSIVIMIIGLLVGSVLFGRDMIENATLRSQISQIDKLRTAANVFRLKYDGLPGDLLYIKATAMGLYAPTTDTPGAAGFGDGNGLIDAKHNGMGMGFFCMRNLPDATESSAITALNGEPLIFYRHLSETRLIEGDYATPTGVDEGNITTGAAIAMDATNPSQIARYVPPAKLQGSILVDYLGITNYFLITKILSTSTDGTHTAGPALTPFQAYAIDAKFDDGLPMTGTVRASATSGLSMICANLECINWNSAPTYQLTTTTQTCSLMLAF